MAIDPAAEGIWDIYKLRDGREIRLLNPRASVAYAARNHQITTRFHRNQDADPPAPSQPREAG